MGMQTDVKTTKPLTSSGDFKDQNDATVGRCRIKGIYAVGGATAGSVVIRDGSASGAIVFTLNTPAEANGGAGYILLPGEGILVETSLYGVVTTATSIVVIYG